MKKLLLPNQLSIATLNNTEARILYHEIFTAGAYQKHGVELKKNDCVFDIGANIGMFALYANSRCTDIKLFAFEPVQRIYEVLKQNVTDHLKVRDVHLFHRGLSDKNESVSFNYTPSLSMTAGRYSEELKKTVQKNISLCKWMQALLSDFVKSNHRFNRIINGLIKGLQIPILQLLLLLIVLVPLSIYLFFLKFTTQTITCRLQPLSAVIKENSVTQIDLCKIDVEGSEWDVLLGIDTDDWSLFKQFIIEVHDIDGRVMQMQNYLEQKGFEVIVDQEDWELHQLMNIYTIYAKKKQLSCIQPMPIAEI